MSWNPLITNYPINNILYAAIKIKQHRKNLNLRYYLHFTRIKWDHIISFIGSIDDQGILILWNLIPLMKCLENKDPFAKNLNLAKFSMILLHIRNMLP